MTKIRDHSSQIPKQENFWPKEVFNSEFIEYKEFHKKTLLENIATLKVKLFNAPEGTQESIRADIFDLVRELEWWSN